MIVANCGLREHWLARHCYRKQRQLLVQSLRGPLVGTSFREDRVADAIFLAEARDKLCHALAVGRRQKRAVLIALAIVLDQLREVLLKEGKENRCRTGLQEQRSGEDVAGSGCGGGAHHGLQICGRIGDAGQNGRATHAHSQPRVR